MIPRDVYTWTNDVLCAMRLTLEAHGFIEILPVIVSRESEPGAFHSIAVMGNHALPQVSVLRDAEGERKVVVSGIDYYYLPVSHSVEKQIVLEYLDNVYCITPCLRQLFVGENESKRHLHTFFQVEIEWRTERAEEVYAKTESLLARFSEELIRRRERSGIFDEETRRRIKTFADTPYKRITFEEARGRVASSLATETSSSRTGDISHAEQAALSNSFSSPFWLTDYPDGVRDSLYRRLSSGDFATYDLMLPNGYGEVSSGGLRPDSREDIIEQRKRLGASSHTFYAEWKFRTGVQSGGLGIGTAKQ